MVLLKILVTSDTHGSIEDILNSIEIEKPDYIIHLGDNFPDAEDIESITDIETIYVRGNCDFFHIGRARNEELLKIGGKNIFITHGHKYGIKNNYDKLYKKASNLSADVILFGHSHEQTLFEKSGMVFMNPGSPNYPRGKSNRGYGIIEKLGKEFQYKLVEI